MVAFTAEEPPVTLPRGYSISRPFMASAVKPQSCRTTEIQVLSRRSWGVASTVA